MNTKKLKIRASEVAEALGWNYTTAFSIKSRKSPKDKYEKFLECEKRLLETKEQLRKELTQN